MVTLDLLPQAAAEEAAIVDDAFRVLLVLGVPVFAFVLSGLIYAILRFRHSGEPDEDGPPIRTHGRIIAAWFLVTTALTVVMIIYPGAIGLADLRERADEAPYLVVQVKSSQWMWEITYPEYGTRAFTEMVLPLGKHVRFEVTSTDVLHAFWVPAFRMKIDAVPGMVTTVSATPDRTDAPGLELRCAELCGVGHGVMVIPVRVVEFAEFESWVAQQLPSS